MKKAMKISAITVGGLIGAGLIFGAIYDLLGLISKSLKDHDWVVMNKRERKRVSIGNRLKFITEAADDVMKDAKEGWAWRHGN